jgi:outer membrane biosynthesis protein TonB
VLDVMLVSGSGSPILDAAAESVLRNAILPPFTSRMERDTITVTVRLRYTLTN